MKHLIWITLLLGASVHAANQKFDCGTNPSDAPADAFQSILVLKPGNHLFEIDHERNQAPSTFELFFDEKNQDDFIFAKQVVTVRLKKDGGGRAYDVRLIIDGEKPRVCEPIE